VGARLVEGPSTWRTSSRARGGAGRVGAPSLHQPWAGTGPTSADARAAV